VFVKIFALLALSVFGMSDVRAADESGVSSTLNAFHRAASESDFSAYSAIISRDIVFLGTDATERWRGAEFSDFAAAHFSKGEGWSYNSTERHITMSAGGRIAWFDEMLSNEKLGKCRGSGVLVKEEGGWKLAQYNLSLPVPNEIVESIVADIAQFEQSGTLKAKATESDTADRESLSESPEDAQNKCRNKKRFKTNRKADC
jgi:ketosteroid isomerase-like protein